MVRPACANIGEERSVNRRHDNDVVARFRADTQHFNDACHHFRKDSCIPDLAQLGAA